MSDAILLGDLNINLRNPKDERSSHIVEGIECHQLLDILPFLRIGEGRNSIGGLGGDFGREKLSNQFAIIFWQEKEQVGGNFHLLIQILKQIID